MKIAICGPSRCGKDTAAACIARLTGLRFGMSTSEVIVPHVARKFGLSDEEMYARRHEFRADMLLGGRELRAIDPAFLARQVLKSGDLVVGVRDQIEMETVRAESLVDLALWIDRPGLDPDPTMGYGPELTDIVIFNHWGLAEFEGRLRRLAATWGASW